MATQRTHLYLGLVSGLVAGLILGWALGWLDGERGGQPEDLTASGPGTPDTSPAEAGEAGGDPRGAEAGLRSPAGEPAASGTDELPAEPAGGPEPGPEDPALVGARLRAHADRGIAEGWREVRPEPIPGETLALGHRRFDDLVHEAPRGIGRDLGEQESAREEALADARAGGVFDLLESLEAGGVGPVVDLVRDTGRFEAFFTRQVSETATDGFAHRAQAGEAVDDGVTLTFPDGVFRVQELLSHHESFPRDVTLAGAGMDVTLLVLGDLSTPGLLRNFRIRDCTVYTANAALTDLRVKPAAIRLERVRLVGFDSGAGGSNAFEARGLALHASDCRILGGYGRSPVHGSLFDVRSDGLLARFDRCTFDLLDLDLPHLRPGATVVFLGCTMRELLGPRSFDPADPGHDGVVFDRCIVGFYTGDRAAIGARDLDDLFPDWEARLQ